MNRLLIRSPMAAGAKTVPALLALAAVLAVPARAEESERARIAQERAAIETRYGERERACRERFVVTSCIDEAKRDRRQGLDALRARELKLDEERRRQRTEARRAELAAKAADDARRERERAARAASAPAARTPRPLEPRRQAASDAAARAGEPHDRPSSGADRLGIKPARSETAAERREREERSRARYEARQRQAAEHREEVQEKASKRQQERPPAAPLPVPGASAPR